MVSPSSEEAHASSPPLLKWAQDAGCVYISATFPGSAMTLESSSVGGAAAAPYEASVMHAPNNSTELDMLHVHGPKHAVALRLYAPVVLCKSQVKLDGSLAMVLEKQRPPARWPRLTEATTKYHFISIDWSRWTGDDDDELPDGQEEEASRATPPPPSYDMSHSDLDGVAAYSMLGPIDVTPEDQKEPEHAPDFGTLTTPLTVEAARETEAGQFWMSSVSPAQRLHTLTRMWNVCPSGERPALLRTMVGLMEDVDPQLCNHVKGGSEILNDLNAEEYSKRGIAYVGSWIGLLGTLSSEEARRHVLTALFSLGTEFEKKVVCSTFI